VLCVRKTEVLFGDGSCGSPWFADLLTAGQRRVSPVIGATSPSTGPQARSPRPPGSGALAGTKRDPLRAGLVGGATIRGAIPFDEVGGRCSNELASFRSFSSEAAMGPARGRARAISSAVYPLIRLYGLLVAAGPLTSVEKYNACDIGSP